MTETKQERARRVWEKTGRHMLWPDSQVYFAVRDFAPAAMTLPSDYTASEEVSVQTVVYYREPLFQGRARIGWIITTDDGIFVKVF